METLAQFAQSLGFRIALATIVLLSFGIYGILNIQPKKFHVLTGRLDGKIPFWPAFSLPYLLYFPYLFFMIVYGIIKTPFYAQIAGSALVVQLAASVVYAKHQTHVPRPTFKETGPFSRLTALIYRYDRPFCAFPSLHVAYSALCAAWAVVMFPSLAPFFLIFSATVIAATLFLKQHALADVFGGLCLALAGLLIFR